MSFDKECNFFKDTKEKIAWYYTKNTLNIDFSTREIKKKISDFSKKSDDYYHYITKIRNSIISFDDFFLPVVRLIRNIIEKLSDTKRYPDQIKDGDSLKDFLRYIGGLHGSFQELDELNSKLHDRIDKHIKEEIKADKEKISRLKQFRKDWNTKT